MRNSKIKGSNFSIKIKVINVDNTWIDYDMIDYIGNIPETIEDTLKILSKKELIPGALQKMYKLYGSSLNWINRNESKINITQTNRGETIINITLKLDFREIKVWQKYFGPGIHRQS